MNRRRRGEPIGRLLQRRGDPLSCLRHVSSDGPEQHRPIPEMAVERGDPDLGATRDRLQRCVGSYLHDDAARSVEESASVSCSVGSHGHRINRYCLAALRPAAGSRLGTKRRVLLRTRRLEHIRRSSVMPVECRSRPAVSQSMISVVEIVGMAHVEHVVVAAAIGDRLAADPRMVHHGGQREREGDPPLHRA